MSKILIKESELVNIIKEELTKKDVVDMIKNNKDIDKQIKQVVAEVMTNLFQLLWQQKDYFRGNIAR